MAETIQKLLDTVVVDEAHRKEIENFLRAKGIADPYFGTPLNSTLRNVLCSLQLPHNWNEMLRILYLSLFQEAAAPSFAEGRPKKQKVVGVGYASTSTGVDTSKAVIRDMFDTSGVPPSYDELPPVLGLLPRPLPVTEYVYRKMYTEDQSVEQLLIPESIEPAGSLAQIVSNGLYPYHTSASSSELDVYAECQAIFLQLMCFIATELGYFVTMGGNTKGLSGATHGNMRPDLIFCINNILLFKGELKRDTTNFYLATNELQSKMAKWSPRLHGKHTYMLCFAAAGKQIQFFAVQRGGGQCKPISRQFNISLRENRAQVMHLAGRVLDIILKQAKDLPDIVVPIGLDISHGHSTISWFDDHVQKKVVWSLFQNRSAESTIIEIYELISQTSNGRGLEHPHGLPRIIKKPRIRNIGNEMIWEVSMLVGVPYPKCRPTTTCDLQKAIHDILIGLSVLHTANYVHRDIRWPNVVYMLGAVSNGSYILIDYEHGGKDGESPSYDPLAHWPEECKAKGSPYTKAADMHSIGQLMGHEDVWYLLDNEGRSLVDLLCDADCNRRLGVDDALKHSWFSKIQT